MNNKVYLLWFHTKGDEDEEDAILIGVYESEPAAGLAIERLKDKRGFIDFPQGFRIYSRELGEDSWTEGFFVHEGGADTDL
jgi:homoserine kinase type II